MIRAERAPDGTVSIHGLSVQQAWDLASMAFGGVVDTSEGEQRDADMALVAELSDALDVTLGTEGEGR